MTWPVRRVRELACFVNGYPFKSEDFLPVGDVPLVRVRDVLGCDFETYVPASVVPEAFILKNDDVVIGMDGDFNARLWDRGPAALNQRVCALRTKPGNDSRFLAYALPRHLRKINDVTYSTTVKHLSGWQVEHIQLPVPQFNEQRIIATFLDRETGLIDALIVKQNVLVDVLRERLSALLTQHFQSMHGKVQRSVRQALVRLDRPTQLGLGVVTAYRDGVVTLRSNRREDGYTMSEAEAGYQGVLAGDLVFHALDGFAGAVGISDSQGVCTPVYHVCRPKGDDDPAYLALLLRYLGTSGFLAVQAPNVRQRSVDFRNWSTFARIPLMLPPVDEQRAFMASYADQKANIETVIAKTRQHVEYARERRNALISAAVTGQIAVTGRG